MFSLFLMWLITINPCPALQFILFYYILQILFILVTSMLNFQHHPSCSKKNTWRAIPVSTTGAHTSCLQLNADDHSWWTTMLVKRHQQSGAEKKKKKTKPAHHFHVGYIHNQRSTKTMFLYIYIYISGGPLSALTCCVNARLLSAIKKISPLIYSQSWVGSWVYTTQAMMTFTLIF